MTENTFIYVPIDLVFTCPSCSEDVEIFSVVMVSNAEVTQTSDARRSGPAEFGATVETEVLGVDFRHNCVQYPEPEEDEEEDSVRAPRGGIRYDRVMPAPRNYNTLVRRR